jgi:hypothetical protein
MNALLVFLQTIPGLAAAAVAILKTIAGTGLGFEKWEVATQKAAGFFGIILTLSLVYLFGEKRDTVKKRVIITFLFVVGVFLLGDWLAGVAEKAYANTDMAVFWMRDVLYKATYFLLCLSTIGLIGCIGLFFKK